MNASSGIPNALKLSILSGEGKKRLVDASVAYPNTLSSEAPGREGGISQYCDEELGIWSELLGNRVNIC